MMIGEFVVESVPRMANIVGVPVFAPFAGQRRSITEMDTGTSGFLVPVVVVDPSGDRTATVSTSMKTPVAVGSVRRRCPDVNCPLESEISVARRSSSR
jgi:hypothetical protein